MDGSATVDGEIAACDAEERPSSAELQKRLHVVRPGRVLLGSGGAVVIGA